MNKKLLAAGLALALGAGFSINAVGAGKARDHWLNNARRR